MGRAGTQTDRSTPWAVAIGAGALAFCVRWNLGGRLSGLHAYYGYDDGVYFASAVSFVHGLMPYDDYLLLHPPGITLALAPFALLTHWLSDSDALAVARIAFMLVGAANTVLVSRIALRWGLRSATVAGALYAVSYAAANTEYLTLLEPLGTLCLLGGVALLLRSTEPAASTWWTYGGGAVLGLGLVVKIWDIVPVLIVLGWLTVASGRAAAVRAGASAVVTASATLLPFGIEAGRRMLRLVVLDQLGRPRGSADLATRLGGVSGVDLDARLLPAASRPVLLAVALGVVVLAAAIAWTSRRARLWVVMLAAQLLVLATSPSYLMHYAAYATPALVLVVAAAASTLTRRRSLALLGAAAIVLGLATVPMVMHPVRPFPVGRVSALLPERGCVRTDSPGALVLLDRMSSELARGCQVPIDFSGQTYDVGSKDAHGRPVPRVRNAPWQRAAVHYLTSGSAAVLVRGAGDGFDASTRATLDHLTSFRLHGFSVLLTSSPTSPSERR